MNPEENPLDPSLASPLKQIRTYQGDVANALHNQNESLVSIQRAEVVRSANQEVSQRLLSPEELEERKITRSGIWLAVGIIILLALGAVGGFYAYQGYKIKTAVPPAVLIPNTFFSTDIIGNINTLTLNRDGLIQTVQAEKLKNDTNIEQINLRKGDGSVASLLATEGFLALMQSHAPANLIRAFNPLFMLGVLGAEKHTFLLIKLDSYENAFPGMLEWEQNLSLDLLPLFANQEMVATIPSDTIFKDITIQNKDARILKDPSGQTVLLYSFFDNNMLIITDSEETLKSLITRLTSEKLMR